MNIIKFPGLGLELNLNPVAFTVWGKGIYWYGIIIAAAVLFAVIYVTREMKKQDLNPDILYDLLIFAIPSAIICARLYYVLFNLNTYKNNLLEIFAIWNGGIAIYGAVIGGFSAAYFYCRIKKLPFLKIADIVAPSFALAQAIGRWGNFINSEAFGYETALPWRMGIYAQNYAEVHPTFLYESIWNLAVFFVLHRLLKKKPYEGNILLWYFFLYGLGRIWIEGLRTDSLIFLGMRISQIVALASIIICGWLLYKFNAKKRSESIENKTPLE